MSSSSTFAGFDSLRSLKMRRRSAPIILPSSMVACRSQGGASQRKEETTSSVTGAPKFQEEKSSARRHRQRAKATRGSLAFGTHVSSCSSCTLDEGRPAGPQHLGRGGATPARALAVAGRRRIAGRLGRLQEDQRAPDLPLPRDRRRQAQLGRLGARAGREGDGPLARARAPGAAKISNFRIDPCPRE